MKLGSSRLFSGFIIASISILLWPLSANAESGDLERMGASAASAENLSSPQKNAVRSANVYLSMSGFSREGLIHQLSSSYGEGYDVIDARVAVDSLSINWDEQAVRSAKEYLDMMGFSCRGLIKQLSSDAGSKYTNSQATYGAHHAGAC